MSVAVCHRLSASLSGRPIAMEPFAFKAALDALGPRLGVDVQAMEDEAGDGPSLGERKRSAEMQRLATVVESEQIDVGNGMAEYALTPGGIAILTISGTLVDRWDWLSAMCGMVSYDAIRLMLDAAADDARVTGILLDVDSPGGEAAGMLDIADHIRAVNARKPVWAAANSLAASAGYGIAAAGSRLTVPRLGTVGSIGVVAVHIDQSAQDAERGLSFTAMYSGARKIDGWGHAPLAEAARKRFQAQLDEARRKFATSVAKHRNLELEAVLATEAAVFDDEEGVRAGLADAVQPFGETLAEFTDQVRSRGPNLARSSGALHPGGAPMANKTETKPALSATSETDEDKNKTAPTADPKAKADEPKGGSGEGGAPAPAPEADKAATVSRADAATISEICTAAGVPAMAAALIRDGATVEQATARADQAGKIRAAVASARKLNPEAVAETAADDFIKQGSSLETVRAALFDALEKKQSPELDASVQASSTGGAPKQKHAINHAEIYGRMNGIKAA